MIYHNEPTTDTEKRILEIKNEIKAIEEAMEREEENDTVDNHPEYLIEMQQHNDEIAGLQEELDRLEQIKTAFDNLDVDDLLMMREGLL